MLTQEDTLSAFELSCDVVCLMYDISNPHSFEYVARIYKVCFLVFWTAKSKSLKFEPALNLKGTKKFTWKWNRFLETFSSNPSSVPFSWNKSRSSRDFATVRIAAGGILPKISPSSACPFQCDGRCAGYGSVCPFGYFGLLSVRKSRGKLNNSNIFMVCFKCSELSRKFDQNFV